MEVRCHHVLPGGQAKQDRDRLEYAPAMVRNLLESTPYARRIQHRQPEASVCLMGSYHQGGTGRSTKHGSNDNGSDERTYGTTRPWQLLLSDQPIALCPRRQAVTKLLDSWRARGMEALITSTKGV